MFKSNHFPGLWKFEYKGNKKKVSSFFIRSRWDESIKIINAQNNKDYIKKKIKCKLYLLLMLLHESENQYAYN